MDQSPRQYIFLFAIRYLLLPEQRILLQQDQPKADAGEITEKGYINQGRVQALRQDQVDRLYAKSPDEEIIEV